MMYESPIEVVIRNIRTEWENGIIKAVHGYDVNCNKEELIKALAYDRDQYRKGFEDGRPKWIPCSERLPKARESVFISTKEWTGEGCYWETTEYHVIWKGYRWNATYWDDEVIAWMPLPKPYKGEKE